MPESGEPHSPQNFIPGVFGFAHEGQTTARKCPHSPQNLRPASFSNPQFVQIILSPGRRSGRGPAKGTASIRDLNRPSHAGVLRLKNLGAAL
jgi:hypothetical protein